MNIQFILRAGDVIQTRLDPPGVYTISVVFPDNEEMEWDQISIGAHDEVFLTELQGAVLSRVDGIDRAQLLYMRPKPAPKPVLQPGPCPPWTKR